MTQQQRVSPLAEGAFLALITALMGALAIHLLPVKFLVDFIWGIPIIVIILRHNFRAGLLTLATASFITWILAGPVMTLLLIIELGPLALAYGLMFRSGVSSGTVLLGGSVVSVISMVLTMLGFAYIANVNIIPTEQEIRSQMDLVKNLYVSRGVMGADEAALLMQNSVSLIRVLIPSAFTFASVIRAFLTYIVAVKVLDRLGCPVKPLPPFREWKLPWYSVWFLIMGLGMSLIGDQYKFGSLAMVGKNLVFIVLPIFFITGLAVVTSFFKAWKIPVWIKVLLVVAGVVNISGSIILLTLVGVFDPFVSFRKRRPKEQ